MNFKKKVLSGFLVILSFTLYAQDEDSDRKPVKYFSNHQLYVDVYHESWLNAPEHIDFDPLSLGVEIKAVYVLAGKHSNVCLTTGLSLHTQNLRMNSKPATQDGYTDFYNIPENLDYAKNKFNITYIDIPIEVRIRSNPNHDRKSYKIFLGFKGGYMLANHTKYIGELPAEPEVTKKIKEYNIKYILPYRYGLSARIGFGRFSASAFYSLTGLFEENKGPEMYPLSLGLGISIF